MGELRRIDAFDSLQVIEHAASWCSGVLHADGQLLGRQEAILKFKAFSVCEVIGYQLAAGLGVPVPNMRGIWTPRGGSLGNNCAYGAFRIGILLEELPNLVRVYPIGHIRREQVDGIGRDSVARALVLCMFARDEWGEFVCSSDNRVCFIDLETTLGRLEPENLVTKDVFGRKLELKNCKKAYCSGNRASVASVLNEADRLGIRELVEAELRSFCEMPKPDRAKLVSITGHPLAPEISDFSIDLLESTITVIASAVDIR